MHANVTNASSAAAYGLVPGLLFALTSVKQLVSDVDTTTKLGWRDRDWARFSDEEWRALYGAGRRIPRRRPDWARRIAYSLVGVAVVAVVAFAVTVAPPRVTTPAAAAPDVVYGIPGSGTKVGSNSPSGRNTVCTEMVASSSSGRWYCIQWQINLSHLPVVQPHPYRGPCEHMAIDQGRGAWTCLGSGASPPPNVHPRVHHPRNDT